MEREVIPMCRDQGMAIAPWAPLGQGRFKTAEAREAAHAGGGRSAQMSEDEVKVSQALEAVAKPKKTSLHAVVCLLFLAICSYGY
jgi:aryl-alcohol dehydrogenase-like predicted oxidoreductase